jgi:hypothetical protein
MQKYLIVIIISIIGFTSCRKDFTAELSSGNLVFSKDTVFLDTVFTNIGSSTYNLKVYNKSSHAIAIPNIKLGKGENSLYRLNVDGIPGKQFQNVEILAKDSMYVFVETTINFNQVTNPIYTDSIVFDSGDKLQDVKLVTLVQDAHFLYPSKNANSLVDSIKIGIDSSGNEIKVNGFYLNDNTTFTNEKPYVIYGYCAVPNGKTLTVNAGANIYFHANSGLIIDKNATLIMNGETNNTINIEGDRLEPEFSNVPGQWGTIWLRAGSKNNLIDNTIIKNASTGIIIDSLGNNNPTLTIKNSQIYNSSNYGMLGRETNIYGENLVVNNSGQSSLACTVGGTYNFVHATFANFWNQSLRQFPSVLINNYFTYIKDGTEVIEPRNLQAANFTNCIIDGNNNIEFILDKAEGANFNYAFKNNLLHFNDFNQTYTDISEYNFEDINFYMNNILNGNADFKNPNNNELIVGENSDGIQNAEETASQLVPYDILGILRSSPADIGAYQHINFN